MYKVNILFLLLTTTSAKVLNKTNNDCTFNESSKITPQELLYCRYIRDDWTSSDISIPELNFYFELQFELEKNKQKIFYDTFYNVCENFNIKSLFDNLLIKLQKLRSRNLGLRPGAYKNLSVIKSHNTWLPFNVLSKTVHKDLFNASELEIGCKLFCVYEMERMFYVYFDIAYSGYTSKHILTTSKLYGVLYRDLYQLILENPSFTIWKDLLSIR